MAHNISIAIVYLFEFLISYIFFKQVSNLRKNKITTIFIGLVCFAVAAIINITLSMIWLNFLTFFLANCILSMWCFEVNLKQSVFYSVVLDIVSTATEYITFFIVSVVSGEEVAYTFDQGGAFLLNAFICKTLFFFISLLLTRFISKNDNITKVPVTFYFYPLAVVAVLLFLWNVYISFDMTESMKITVTFISAMMLLSTIILFVSYRNNIDRENKMHLLEQEVTKTNTEKSYYQILEHQNKNLMMYAHDTKNHLIAIRSLTDDEKIISYIEKLTDGINKYSKLASSGNHSLDVIINKYITECEIKSVKFTYDIKKSNLLNVEINDMVSILGNLLDNALEAAETSKEKFIHLQTERKNGYDIVTIKNSYDNKPQTDGDKLKTTKTNKRFHGLGIKSIKTALKKYNGEYNWEYNEAEKTFSATVTFLL